MNTENNKDREPQSDEQEFVDKLNEKTVEDGEGYPPADVV